MSNESPTPDGPPANAEHKKLVIGVLALQGAFVEHEAMLLRCSPNITTRQIRVPSQLIGLDAIVLPGGESTAIGLIGQNSGGDGVDGGNMWDALKQFINVEKKPCWGTCAGMILLAERCVGSIATIVGGQALIGSFPVTVCRNYFGSQISSCEIGITPPPDSPDQSDFPGIFIRAPAVLSAQGDDVEVLSTILATPCRAAHAILVQLDERIKNGESITQLGVADYESFVGDKGKDSSLANTLKKRKVNEVTGTGTKGGGIEEEWDVNSEITLPGATGVGGARKVICAARNGHVLVTSFHPELSEDIRWHQYFVDNVVGKAVAAKEKEEKV